MQQNEYRIQNTGDFVIYYLLFTIDYFSVASVLSVADRKSASIGDFLGIWLTFCVTVRIIYNIFVCSMWYVEY